VSGFIDWLAGLPSFALFLGLMVVGLLVAAGLSWLSTRAIEDDVRTRTSTSVTTVVGVVAGLYAVRVPFVIVNEWQTFNDAQAKVSDESAALTAAYFDAGVLPEPTATQIQVAIVEYDRSVICDEIPYLADHQGPAPATRAALQRLYETTASAPAAVQASPFYRDAVSQIAAVSTARRGRINAAGSPLPELLLVVILATSLALVAVASVLDTQHRRWHLVLTTALTTLVALNLALVITLNRPFDGAATISDAPLREGVPAALLRCDATK
jgi:cytochrome bd-type quinol oxidase subunit 2